MGMAFVSGDWEDISTKILINREGFRRRFAISLNVICILMVRFAKSLVTDSKKILVSFAMNFRFLTHS